ncbi:sterile alpha motif domain-containing protein 9-like, partial [Pseudoliparis swirei]|uniref:sterile alpha motif domain-containing protein 9-like n=1 Tax=Pseudoliparis swirei TaxID=2059687 RepID=UPI0024BE3449
SELRRSTMELPTSVEKWTKEDVRLWLMTVVKVHDTYANFFFEEEVSGDMLVCFEKKDILDLGIHHGPAVKITSYLESLKEGSEYESQFPAYVKNWTKEQVNQWLQQHLGVYSKYAERLQEEDVSGDCLVCFKKQDLLDLALKNGPAVKILAKLRQLNMKPEPTLQPVLHNSTDPRESPKPTQPELVLSQDIAIKQPDSCNEIESKTDKILVKESEKVQLPFQKVSEKEGIHQPQDLGARRKGAIMTTVPPKSTVEIQKILDDLLKDDFKMFKFCLKVYTQSKHNPIPQGKLQHSDTMDTATLMTNNYGCKEALQVTKAVLKEINQQELARQMEKNMCPLEQQSLPKDVLNKEANQGDKLQNLLTCGGNSLDKDDHFIVVVNKSSPEQVQYLQFLGKLKPFCVLDFDPNSVAPGGLCHSYRESRVANLHTPSQYQGPTESVIKTLNLYKQTSWVFCNGRHDLDGDLNKELDYKNWLRKSCKDVEQLISFICNPDVLPRGGSLVIFLLLSPVDTEKDPMFDIYKSFIKQTKEESTITICESQGMYEKWRDLVQEKCDSDIDSRSIYELTSVRSMAL